MINLLPPYYREKLKAEKRLRLLLLLGAMLGIALVALSIFLLVIQAALSKEHFSQEEKLSSFEERAAGENSTLVEIKNWNSKLRNIAGFKERRRQLTQVFKELESSLPQELTLLSFSYTPAFETRKKEDEVVRTPATIAVTGKAQTRERLLFFKDALQANPFFSQVLFPPSNWVSPADITFSFQAKLKDLP